MHMNVRNYIVYTVEPVSLRGILEDVVHDGRLKTGLVVSALQGGGGRRGREGGREGGKGKEQRDRR